jgi:serine/threonine protein kinase
MPHEIRIAGQSGCNVEIVQYENKTAILKTSDDPNYLPRLHRQLEKQSRFRVQSFQNITIPKILNITPHGGYMEYYNYIDVFEFIQIASKEELDCFINTLIQFIKENIKNSPTTWIGSNIFKDKFLSLKPKLPYKKINLDRLYSRFVSNGCNIPVGYSHGDLTLSNILVGKKSGNVVLIDFLDSFIETPLQDIVKLRQDTTYKWSLNFYSKTYDPIKVEMVLQYFDKRIIESFKGETFFDLHYKNLEIFNFLRLLPYIKDRTLAIKVCDIINDISET